MVSSCSKQRQFFSRMSSKCFSRSSNWRAREAISSLAAPASSRLDWNFFRSAAFSFWSSSTWTVSKEPLGLLGFFFSLNEIEDDEMRRNLFDVITLDVPKVLQRHHRLLRLGRFLMEGAPSSTTLPTLPHTPLTLHFSPSNAAFSADSSQGFYSSNIRVFVGSSW